MARVWLIETGEPLPTDGGGSRLWRIGLLAETLAGRGHEVTWWVSDFDHFSKTRRPPVSPGDEERIGYRLVPLHGPPYRANVSLARFLNHRAVARDFLKRSGQHHRPDVLHCCMPTIDLADAAARYARAHRVPLAIDIRDLWPDVIAERFPFPLRPLAGIALAPLERKLRRALGRATALCGVTRAMAAWGLDRAGREATALDRAFPLAIPAKEFSEQDLDNAARELKNRGLDLDDDVFTAVFIGSLSPRLELAALVDAARIVEKKALPIRFLICGRGEDEHRLQKRAAGLKNVAFTGWINEVEIRAVLGASRAGIAPYPPTPDFSRSIPNKIAEYLSGGLPVVHSLSGPADELLAQNNCALRYRNNDPSDLARALEVLAGNPEQRREMTRRASALFQQNFRADRVMNRMADWLEQLAAQD